MGAIGAMRAQRPLLVGLTLAAVVIVGYAAWQIAFRGRELSADSSRTGPDQPHPPQPQGSESGLFLRKPHDSNGNYDALRERMVRDHMAARDITHARVLEVMRKVPRHKFVPADQVKHAYEDRPLAIGHDQTISQPYIVALMTQLARPTPDSVALDVGTGSGYQTAVLAELCQSVYSIEIVEPLAESAKKRLAELGYENATVRCGNGYRGWPEKAPFDVIIVAAAPEQVPQPLVDQLKPGGRLVIPVGTHRQELVVIEKQPDGSLRRESVAPVAFVPMTGRAAEEHK